MSWSAYAIIRLFAALAASALPCELIAAVVLTEPEPPFKGKIGSSATESIPDWPLRVQAPQGAPNVVLIILDDVGFGATSTFGGPSETPHLDELAKQGLRYNRFHVTASCSPTRAALLSGRNAHKVGFGVVVDLATGFPGYNGMWKRDAVGIAEILRRNGYSTAAFGKWHNTPYWEVTPVGPFDRWPTGLGFEHFYGFMGGEDSQWEPTLFHNTTPIEPPKLQSPGYHFTTDIADEAINWVRTQESLAPNKPYFLYFAAAAGHIPHHVPKQWIEKYRSRFNHGWDKLRRETFARQRELGIIPMDAELTSRPENLPAWDSLSADQHRLLARQMELSAAFLSHADHEIGRLVNEVQQSPRGQNTLILYVVSDNGAAPGGPEGSEGPGHPPPLQKRLQRMDELGSEHFMNNGYASAWAWADNTPFQGSKGTVYFGGTRAPFVVSWPARIKDRGNLRSQFVDATDIASTIYEATGVQFPSVIDGIQQQPLDGVSFAYSFDDHSAASRHRTQLFEIFSRRAIYQDGWLALADAHSNQTDDSSADPWKLYYIDADFSQAKDLANERPHKVDEFKVLFDKEARKNNVYPLQTVGDVYSSLRAGMKWPNRGRRFVYHAGLPRTYLYKYGHLSVPDFSSSHRITAQIEIPKAGAKGVIIAVGSRYAGFALYVKDDHLVYENHFLGRDHDIIRSRTPLPSGSLELAYEFSPDADKGMKAGYTGDPVAPGIGRLYINGELAGEGNQGPVMSWVWGYGAQGGTLGIGRTWSPVGAGFQPPFNFTGTLEKVTVELL